MKVAELMTKDVDSCRADDPMSRAADIMWKRDCGVAPVVDADLRVVGMITDRDVCMAAYTRGLALHDMRVRDSMSSEVVACHPGDSVAEAHGLLRSRRVRRLPVIDGAGKLIGLLSLNDITRWVAREKDRVNLENLVATAAAACEPRGARKPAGQTRSMEHALLRRVQSVDEPLIARQADLQC